MKVIHQLISYLEHRGLLTAEQLEQLRRDGYAPQQETEDDEPFPPALSEWEIHDLLDRLRPDDQFELLDEEERAQIRRETRGGRGRTSGGRPAKPRRSTTLTARLTLLIPTWEGDLSGLLQAARGLLAVTDLDQAFRAIRTSPPDAFVAAISAGLDARRPSLALL